MPKIPSRPLFPIPNCHDLQLLFVQWERKPFFLLWFRQNYKMENILVGFIFFFCEPHNLLRKFDTDFRKWEYIFNLSSLVTRVNPVAGEVNNADYLVTIQCSWCYFDTYYTASYCCWHTTHIRGNGSTKHGPNPHTLQPYRITHRGLNGFKMSVTLKENQCRQ